MFNYYKLLTEISGDTPTLSRAIRESMVQPFLSAWKELASNPQRGKKDMTARPLEHELRGKLKSALDDLDVSVADTGKKLTVWKDVTIVADATVEKQDSPCSILSFKTWLGTGQIRETFGYAYLAKTWHGQKNVRVYMVGLQAVQPALTALINASMPYIDGVFSLCGPPFFDELVDQLRHIYAQSGEAATIASAATKDTSVV